MRYLRPTRLCNSHAPEVVALAHALDAYQKPDHEFMKAAFKFAKEKMTLEIHSNKIFPSQMIPAWQSSTTDTNPLLKTWYDALGYFLLEGEGEAYVDGQAQGVLKCCWLNG